MGVADLLRPVGYVLRGGGSLGAVQVRGLQALGERDIVPGVVAGTSVGSLNGAVVALDPKGAGNRLSHLWVRLTRETRLPASSYYYGAPMIVKGFAPENGREPFTIMKIRGQGRRRGVTASACFFSPGPVPHYALLRHQRPQPALPRVLPPATPRDPVTRAQRASS
jgi:hypothetical protein